METALSVWEELRGSRIFITGGTGFIGCSLLESLTAANDRLNLNISALVLSRDPHAFRRKEPALAAHPALDWHAGDVRTFDFPPGAFHFVIHAAADIANLNAPEGALDLFSTIVEGTRRVLDFTRHSTARRVLFVSSGAVYGKQPGEIAHIPEDYAGAPDPLDPRSAYGEAKRAAELLCALYSERHGIETKIARCFAFAGPRLPLDSFFALGNFIRDALRGGPICVRGDGTARRSYLDASDLAHWLWTILLRGQNRRAYNVGSEHDLSLAELAREVAKALRPGVAVNIAQAPTQGRPPSRYVPSTERARRELGLSQHVSLPESIRRTARVP